MSGRVVYLNGELVPAERAAISVSDAGFLHGASTFTTMLAHNGVVFRLERHLSRLMDTVNLLGLRTDATDQSLRKGVGKVLEANGFSEARMRITLSPGPIDGDSPTSLVTAAPLEKYPSEWYEKGISLIVTSFRQSPEPPVSGFKTGCYLPRVLARREAAARGAEEALWFTSDNRLAESCFNNVFLVLEGKVMTPPLDTPVLGGIVREAVLELCRRDEIPCDDKTPLTVGEMLAADEVFLTGSCSAVRPVVRIERHRVGDGKPGDLTRKIMSAYAKLLDDECSKSAM